MWDERYEQQQQQKHQHLLAIGWTIWILYGKSNKRTDKEHKNQHSN